MVAIAFACCALLTYAATALAGSAGRSQGKTGTGPGTRTKVTLGNPTCTHFVVAPQPTAAKAGRVTFVVSNKGTLGHPFCGKGAYRTPNTPDTHEFVVLKTNLPPGKLPLKAGSVPGYGDKEAVEVGRVAELQELEPGQTRTLTLNLKPGKYVLLCNIHGHYQLGSYAAFRVTSG